MHGRMRCVSRALQRWTKALVREWRRRAGAAHLLLGQQRLEALLEEWPHMAKQEGDHLDEEAGPKPWTLLHRRHPQSPPTMLTCGARGNLNPMPSVSRTPLVDRGGVRDVGSSAVGSRLSHRRKAGKGVVLKLTNQCSIVRARSTNHWR